MRRKVDKAECRELRAAGWTFGELSRRYNASKCAVFRACRKDSGRGGSGQEYMRAVGKRNEATVIALHKAGHRPKMIGYLAGLSMTTVYKNLPPLQTPKMLRVARRRDAEARPCA